MSQDVGGVTIYESLVGDMNFIKLKNKDTEKIYIKENISSEVLK